MNPGPTEVYSIVIPSFNEEGSAPARQLFLERIRQFLHYQGFFLAEDQKKVIGGG